MRIQIYQDPRTQQTEPSSLLNHRRNHAFKAYIRGYHHNRPSQLETTWGINSDLGLILRGGVSKDASFRLSSDSLLTSSALAIDCTVLNAAGTLILILLFIFVVLALVCRSWNPQSALAILILTGQVVTLLITLNVVASSLAQSACASGQFGADCGA